MESLFEKEITLRAVAAKGWISAREASLLAVGQTVMSESFAGLPAELYCESSYLASCDVIIVGDRPGTPLMGLRITDMARPAMENPEPERGEELTELLPFEILIAEPRYALADLEGAGPGTIVSLDREFVDELPCTLRIAGLEAARGRFAVIGEAFGIMVDEVLYKPEAREGFRISGSVIDRHKTESGNKVKIYDFKRPDHFTKAQIVAVAAVHERVLESLRERFPELAAYKLTLVDQLNYGEWLDATAKAKAGVIAYEANRPGRSYSRENESQPRGKALVQPAKARFPLSRHLAERIALWLSQDERFLSRHPALVCPLGGLSPTSFPPEILANCLRSGWKLISDLVFSEAEPMAAPPLGMLTETGYEFPPKGLIREEMILLVSCEDDKGGRLDFVYAATTLYPVTKALERYGRLLGSRR